MNAYLMLLEAEENQLSDSLNDKEKISSISFSSVWTSVKKFLNLCKKYMGYIKSMIKTSLRWLALIHLVTITPFLLLIIFSKFEEERMVYNHFKNWDNDKEWEKIDMNIINKRKETAKIRMVFSLIISLIIILVFFWAIIYLLKNNNKKVTNTESYLLNNKFLNVLIEEEEPKPTNESKLTNKESEGWCRSIFSKLKNFFTANYEKVKKFVTSKVDWSNRSPKVKIITGVAVAAIMGLLFSIVYFKLEGRPIKDIFTMLASFVSNHMHDIGFVVGILLVAVGIYYWKSKKPGDAVDKAVAATA